jgi:hypothetical protein
MKVAIMQPYFFPYIGYFQLINSVDVFVLYDDVNYIKKSWINRNYVLLDQKKHLLTIPCKSISQNKPINTIHIDKENRAFRNVLQTIEVAYHKKAPYFESVFPIIKNVMTSNSETISGLAIESILSACSFLGIKTRILVSSEYFSGTIALDRSERMISISKTLGANELINAIGGIDLYDKDFFEKNGVRLSFIKCFENLSYSQGVNQSFIPNLSIIDVMMFNSFQEIKQMLEYYELV